MYLKNKTKLLAIKKHVEKFEFILIKSLGTKIVEYINYNYNFRSTITFVGSRFTAALVTN